MKQTTNRPKIHSILLTKNEHDVIELCLREAAKWSDFIYVYDGASTDGTWERVGELAKEMPQVIPFRQDGKVFREGLRAEVFNHYRDNAAKGDWWCQLNTDEFYIDDPRAFLQSVNSNRHVVWGIFVQYYITREDVDRVDFSQPCERVLPELRYYNACFTERRFFRHRKRLVWNEADAWPAHLGVAEEQLIRFKHYPYRSPQQIQVRLDVRRDNRARGFEGWETAKQESWKEKVMSTERLEYDLRNESYSLDPAVLKSHITSPPKALLRSLLHRTGIWP